MINYSQNNEQEFILNFFGDTTGRLLDVGAFDGITFSNTRALLEKGWKGTLVEPDPFNIVKLLNNPPPNAQIVFGAVSGVNGLSNFKIETHPDRGWASSLFYTESDRILNPHKSEVLVPSITIDRLSTFPYRFINIDAEGLDFVILKDMPARMLASADLICVEPKGIEERNEMKAFFSRIGFRARHETPENLLVSR